ncbi:MAG: DUF4331 domain-containing protein [Streptosporangiaceae bacterium]
MSSHREAPEISKDPVADSTDLYAFVSPDSPDTTTLIANYLPLQEPAGGPNFYEFGDNVQYDINVDYNQDGVADIIFRFRFTTEVSDEDTFLYNVGPIKSLDSPNWNRRQFYSVTLIEGSKTTTLATGLACPPCNIGPLSTPEYAKLAASAVHQMSNGISVFAGQRAEGFYVDLGAIFDLGNLRPFEQLHNQYGMHIFSKSAPGVNDTNRLNVHSIAIQVPTSRLLDPAGGNPVIGVWTSASRQKGQIYDSKQGEVMDYGPWRQVSRLGNPLFNEVLVPLGKKDLWNALPPHVDKEFASYVTQPGLSALLNDLYPGVFPNLSALVASGAPRADLEAILLTGIPSGIIPGFQNYTGPILADMLRLNTSIPPSSKPNILGVVGGDLAGYPNGRRVFDDVVTIELRALAGLTYPLVDPSYTPDGAASEVTDGLTNTSVKAPYLNEFPYLGVAYGGFYNPS